MESKLFKVKLINLMVTPILVGMNVYCGTKNFSLAVAAGILSMQIERIFFEKRGA